MIRMHCLGLLLGLSPHEGPLRSQHRKNLCIAPAMQANASTVSGSATAGELCKTIDALMSHVSDNHLNASLDGVKCSEEGRSKHQGSVGHNFYTEQREVPWKVDIEKQRGASARAFRNTGPQGKRGRR